MGIRLKTALKGSVPRRRTSLSDALFSTTQQRVLGLLLGQPDRRFRATELIALTGSGSGAVQRELQRLIESGLVTVSPSGSSKYIQANRDAPLFDELHNIVIKTFGLAGPLREALEPVAKQIELALVYGSVAKRSDTAMSDIDLLIVADDLPMERLYAVLEPVERRLGRKISPSVYTSGEFKRRLKAGHGFITRVLGGEHITLIGTTDGYSATRQSGSDSPAQG